MEKVKTIDIELAILREFNFTQKLIVPNITRGALLRFETDMLVLSKSGYATGFEIKTSLSDLRVEFNKPQHAKFGDVRYDGKVGLDRWYPKFKYFNFAVPQDLEEEALKLIPDFCGLWILEKSKRRAPKLREVRKPKILFNYKWSEKQRYNVARLGTMRIYNLMEKIKKYEQI